MPRILPLFVLIAFSVQPASAQTYAQTVWDQLQGAFQVMNEDGDYTLKNYVLGKLGESQSDRWRFPLVEGTQYVVMAACDEDCSDVDLSVTYDGYAVASDTETDDVPILSFVAQASGLHEIEIQMFECSAEPCFWGLGLFER